MAHVPGSRLAPDDLPPVVGTEPAAITSVLLIEDDDGDALLVHELLEETGAAAGLTWVRSLSAAAVHLSAETACVLLDLGLPDSGPDTGGLAGLRAVLRAAPHAAVIVLTGLVDEHRGTDALAAGAQDYLVKGQVDGPLLLRAIRYAVERKRSDEASLALQESSLRAEENARLARGLLPVPLLRSQRVAYATRYRPGNQRSLLGGDFYDVVEDAGGALQVLMGDVCGHGPDEAALGVSLRIAWRTLVLAGVPDAQRLAAMQDVLESERTSEEVFATVCTLEVAPDRRSGSLRLAGHPTPAQLAPHRCLLPEGIVGPAIGVLPGEQGWAAAPLTLDEGWCLLLVTDGLLEGRDGPAGERLGWQPVLEMAPELGSTTATGGVIGLEQLADGLIDAVEQRNGGLLSDDVALLLLRDAG